MAIVVYKPTTPARRKTSVVTHSGVKKRKRIKALTRGKRSSSGRNARGIITVRHRGGGGKRIYRQIDFIQDRLDIPATVRAIEYDPFRSALIASIAYKDGKRAYILGTEGLHVGQEIVSSKDAELVLGNRTVIGRIPAGMLVSNIEIVRGGGGSIARSAGSWCQVMGHEGGKTQLLMPSSEVRLVPSDVLATIGKVGNASHNIVRIGKAGRKRHMGIRPTVRGSVMNPVDHPHGGGEGKTPIGLSGPKTPWGKPARGVKTRRKKKKSNSMILQRRKKRRS